jgi:hypothetical protein
MGAAEATERLGPHQYSAEISFEWNDQDRSVKLVENRNLEAGKGGVSGDFHATVKNSRDQGLEIFRVGGEVYARNRYGKFRSRRRDRGIAEREREEVFGAVHDFDRIFQGRIALKPVGTVSHNGRTAWRYEVQLAKEVSSGADQQLPNVQFAKAGADETTQRRLRFFEKRQPVSLTGEILVDSETSVVVKARLDGQLRAPDEKSGAANLHVTLASEVTDIGKNPKLAAPADALPDADKPQGIADALDQFGIPRKGTDGGTKASDGADVPDDEG